MSSVGPLLAGFLPLALYGAVYFGVTFVLGVEESRSLIRRLARVRESVP